MGSGGSKYKQPRAIPTKWLPGFAATLPSLTGKVVAITGCTTGTGYVCARECARKGAHVILLNRASSRATAAEDKLRKEAPGAVLTSFECDLTSFASVQKAARAMRTSFESLGIDVLCNNAGVMALADQATGDGFDVQMQTNHLSHFLLTREVFPLLEKAAELRGESRVVNHSSLAARIGKPLDEKYLGKNGGNLGGNGKSYIFGGARWLRYHQTKLANVVFTYALSDRLKAAGKDRIKVLCAAPGLAATNLQVPLFLPVGDLAQCWCSLTICAHHRSLPLPMMGSMTDGSCPSVILQRTAPWPSYTVVFRRTSSQGISSNLRLQASKVDRACTIDLC
jgi:NAD(P)-dependent dehydrogenase (short-subunit alcohol dehydrogenase family)